MWSHWVTYSLPCAAAQAAAAAETETAGLLIDIVQSDGALTTAEDETPSGDSNLRATVARLVTSESFNHFTSALVLVNVVMMCLPYQVRDVTDGTVPGVMNPTRGEAAGAHRQAPLRAVTPRDAPVPHRAAPCRTTTHRPVPCCAVTPRHAQWRTVTHRGRAVP